MKKDIYIIKNDINEKVYIGQSAHVELRWIQHLCGNGVNCKNRQLIDNVILKYGKEHFHYEILESEIENYDEREQYWINKYNSLVPNGYNVAIGGNGIGSSINNICAKIKNEDELNNILYLIQETDETFENIAKKYNVSSSVIQSINVGKYYYDPNLKYPLREYFLSEERFKRLVYSLKYEHDKTIHQIANEFNLSASTVNDVNKGKYHKVNWLCYPIRKGKVINPLIDKLDNVINDIQNSALSFKDIAKKYNVSIGSVYTINNGQSYYDKQLKYPLRDIEIKNRLIDNYRSKFSEDEIIEIHNLLKNNSEISISQIAKKFNCNKIAIYNINNGVTKKYHRNNINYPIRKIRKNS